MLSHWPIRYKLLFGTAILCLIIATLAFSSFRGVYAYRELVRGISQRALELEPASELTVKVSELKSRNNSRHISFPRQIAMYLCKALTGASLPETGRRFGGKHHSTVIHAIRKIESKRSQDSEFDRLMETFIQTLE